MNSDLLKRLCMTEKKLEQRRDTRRAEAGTYSVYSERLINPDGPEAAARIAKLEAALLPFAAIADESTANLADNYMYSDCYPMSAFRAAKAALEKKDD